MASHNRLRVLMVAEKPSLAKSIASSLSNNNFKTVKRVMEVYEYNDTFLGNENALFKVTSVVGHVLNLEFPQQFQNWQNTDPAALFNAPTFKKEANPKARVVQHLRAEAAGCDYLVLWLDCDREGENICFEVIENTVPSMRKIRGQQVFRAKFSAITTVEIKKAMNTLGYPNLNESLAVDGRQELDLKVGAAFTRFQTRYFQGKYGNLSSALISYGPCQIPTLNFCVERCQIINEFEPEAYWTLNITISKSGFQVHLQWYRDRVFDQEVALLFQNQIKDSMKLKIISVKKANAHQKKPFGLNTVEMLKVASSAMNMGPHHTMQIAERLYIQGFISYPRTESTKYPPNYDFRSLINSHSKHPIWGPNVHELQSEGFSDPKGGVDAGDHPPISPVICATENELNGESWRLYEYISRHFFASLSLDAVYERTDLSGTCAGETFNATGSHLLREGFTKFMPWRRNQGESLPLFEINEVLKIADIELRQGKTSAPDYITESELISAMEKNGIGTDASIAVHVNNICERNYAKVESGRRMVPTELGIVLIKGYQNIDSELCQPQVRAYVEKQLDLVSKGKVEKTAIVREVLNQFLQKFKFFVLHISRMDSLFEASFSSLSSSGKTFGKCGKCRRYMKYICSKPSRLYCSTCEEIYRLPQGGIIKQYKSLECPLDGFELVLYSASGPNGKTFPLCPYCFSNPPFEGALKVGSQGGKPGMPCTTCLHPSCPNSVVTHGVCSCAECPDGTLVLDPVSAPKWRIDCNRCSFMISLPQNLYSVKVTSERCQDCQSAFLDFKWKKSALPIENRTEEFRACILCDNQILSLCQIHHTKGSSLYSGGRGQRRPHRGGRGGRGKSRGRTYDPLMSFRDF